MDRRAEARYRAQEQRIEAFGYQCAPEDREGDEGHNGGLRSPLQVYRALEQLIEDGTAHKIESLSAFALCTRAECGTDGHAIFAICKKCGRAEEFHDHALERVLRRLATREGFCTKASTIELSGLCETCAHG
ncbi:MAG: transcriptional repressor [Mesorhizobium sp.]|uniref:Fur family transcriptional regulator n=1 Tax=Mesorhizobium sp. TaxID=1871066 RepID=UPI000FE8E7B8|nr:MAG: transcriptional repressor [Mesorhizobium sp.]RWP98740.1 MAG: transcriptional repressor [Mesorhizobium sp.]